MAVDSMLGQLRDDTPRPIILAALQFLGRDAGSAGTSARLDPRLRDFLETALQNAELRPGAERLIRELRLTEFIPQLMETARNRQNSRESRIAAIETMRQLQSPLPLDPLRLMLGEPDRHVAIAAARTISALGNDEAQQTLQGILLKPSSPGDLRKEIVRLLGASKSGALVLLQMAEQGKLAQDLVLEASTATNASPHENIRLMAQQLLPLPKTRTGKPLAPLPVLIQMKGDVPRGKTTFHSTDGPQCHRCHKIAGEGRDVGPDLSRIGGKLAREALLESILNPSAAVSHEYQVWLVRTKSQGYLDGYIRSETQDSMELVDSNGNTIRIQVSDIVSRTRSATSLMPTGLSSGMTTQQLVDLVAYLSTLK
jgi:putative heme-binding domain-containing protein